MATNPIPLDSPIQEPGVRSIAIPQSSLISRRMGCVLLCLVAGRGMAADWRAALQDGSQVEIDPETHKAWRLDGAERAPLWDGVHRLADGSVVIIRDGTAVPNEEMVETWRQPTRETSVPIGSPCDALVKQACGEDYGCGSLRALSSCQRALRHGDRGSDQGAGPAGAGVGRGPVPRGDGERLLQALRMIRG